MATRALGLIEVKGYLGAVVAADAALKAADVSLLNIETVKAGLKTVQLMGDVSAVRAAVDAAVDAVGQEAYYLTSHVISRIDEQTELLLDRPAFNLDMELEQEQDIIEENEDGVAEVSRQLSKYVLGDLEKLKVVKLRSLAYREKDIQLSKKEIKFGNKRMLIQELMKIERKE